MKHLIRISYFILIFFSFSLTSIAGTVLNSSWSDVARGRCSDQTSAWWSSDEAIRIADNVLLYQRDNGGWPKNINMHYVLSQTDKNKLIADKPSTEGGYCTIDNGAVMYELGYLSRVYNALSNDSIKTNIKTGFIKGIQYLLDIQFDNGGWPQFFPFRSATSYSNHITYNDNAMINVMEILRHVYQKDSEYAIKADDTMVAAAQVAFDKGVDCILKTQYKQNGILTVWCAQHNYKTLEPVIARAYELASLSGGESAGIINLLMSLNNPSYEIRQAIYHSVNWYNEVRIKGQRLESFTNSDGVTDKHIVFDSYAADMWARFYTLENSIPFFCDRDGIMVFSIAEIGYERRNGYSWYGNYGNSVISGYSSWFTKWGNSEEQETKVTLPSKDIEYLETDSIPVFANANEYSFGCIKKFELLLDNQLVHEFSTCKIDTSLKSLTTGEHTIIVRSTDDKGHTASDTCKFMVVNAYELSVSNGSGSGFYAKGKKVSIKADAPPSNQIFVNWSGDTDSIADINKASTTLTMPESNLSISANYADDKTGINDYDSEKQLYYCFPNPTSSGFSINLGQLEEVTITIYNLNGQIVYQTNANKGIYTINNHELNAGVYLLDINSKTANILQQKLIIN